MTIKKLIEGIGIFFMLLGLGVPITGGEVYVCMILMFAGLFIYSVSDNADAKDTK